VTTETGYAFAGTPSIGDQLAALTAATDPFTKASLTEIGIEPGWQILDVGAGSGTIATWMADQVGEKGLVTATDLDPSRIPEHPRVQPRQHDITVDGLPSRSYDLIHARLVLIHLPHREVVLHRLQRALRVGGTLVLVDFDCTAPRRLLRAQLGQDDLFTKVVNGINTVLQQAGARLDWGATAAEALVRNGYSDVTTTAYAQSFTGGSPWARLGAVNTRQLHGKLLEVGLTEKELSDFALMMDDPRFTAMSYLMTCTVGRRRA